MVLMVCREHRSDESTGPHGWFDDSHQDVPCAFSFYYVVAGVAHTPNRIRRCGDDDLADGDCDDLDDVYVAYVVLQLAAQHELP